MRCLYRGKFSGRIYGSHKPLARRGATHPVVVEAGSSCYSSLKPGDVAQVHLMDLEIIRESTSQRAIISCMLLGNNDV